MNKSLGKCHKIFAYLMSDNIYYVSIVNRQIKYVYIV